MKRRKAEAALAWNTLVWGATFVMVKSALADISPILFLALRFSLATLALLAIFSVKRARNRRRHRARPGRSGGGPWYAGVLVGLLLFLGYAFQTLGLRLTSAPKSAFITGLSAVLVPLVAALVYRTRPRLREVCGLAVATAGLALMTIEGMTFRVNPGDLLTVLCAIAYAAHIVTLGHFAERISFETLAMTQVGTAAALGLALCWWVEPARALWRPAAIGAILITGLLATALAFTIQAWAQQYTTAARTGLIFMLEPVFAWITSFVLTGEGLSRVAAAGAVLILGGVLLVELKPALPAQHPS
ncbi:MAG TPA: DMT family transporter [Bryobacteraceae bacterium]|nr:DMT family transporter [Bryobacteraceae bacterium]